MSIDVLPASALLNFPPYPCVPSGGGIPPIESWRCPSVFLPDVGLKAGRHARESARPDTLIQEAVRARRRANHKLATGISKDDSWKIGEEDGNWVEPAGTSRSGFDLITPPFNRLLTATQDFMLSRGEGLRYARTKRLFDLIRNALGVRSSFAGPHWPGHGTQQTPYVGPSATASLDNVVTAGNDDDGEICVLLRQPETSVRGLLALARREAEAGWNFAPALLFAEIVAAYLTFLDHYAVFPEPDLAQQVKRAAGLARSAPRLLRRAKHAEDVICAPAGWNRAAWSAWGGDYRGAERGGMEKEPVSWGSGLRREETSEDDGGWVVEAVTDTRPEALNATEALPLLSPLLHPLDPHQITLLHYIPYARRKIIKVLPPRCNKSEPLYTRTLWRLVTAPAPWTPDEKWRERRPRFEREASDDDGSASDDARMDLEAATLEEPDELTIWVEKGIIHFDDGDTLTGMALRGRWAQFGTAI